MALMVTRPSKYFTTPQANAFFHSKPQQCPPQPSPSFLPGQLRPPLSPLTFFPVALLTSRCPPLFFLSCLFSSLDAFFLPSCLSPSLCLSLLYPLLPPSLR